MYLKHLFFVIISFLSFTFVFYSAGKFMVFLSLPYKISEPTHDSLIWSLLINLMLLSMFMLQHSLMSLPKYKRALQNAGLNVITRSIYNLISSILLMALIKYWNVTDFTIWNIDTSNTVMYIFNAIHLFAWSIIYAGCLFMDISEIIGVKQVYYSIRGMPDPMTFKSAELQRLYGHMRHPSLSAFAVIFWIYPIMSLDRLLLAFVLTFYMYTAWKTEKSDFYYHKNQYLKKSQELSHLN